MTIDSYRTPEAEALIVSGRERLHRWRRRRELLTNAVVAGTFVIAAGLIAALAPWQPTFSLENLILVLAVWVVVDSVKFPVASAFLA